MKFRLVSPDQPTWIKAVVYGVLLPAWLLMGVAVFTGSLALRVLLVGFGVFAAGIVVIIVCGKRSGQSGEIGVSEPGEPGGPAVDEWGYIIDPAEAYQHFMLGLYDLRTDALDGGYSREAIRLLNEARELFRAEFEERHPGFGKGRAVWP